MKALLVRFYRFVHIPGLIVLVLGATLGILLFFVDGVAQGAVGGVVRLVGLSAVALVMIVVAATRYSRSASTPACEQVVPRLLSKRDKFCLILRPFGRDAQMVVPKAGAKRRTGGGMPFVRNLTIEQVVANAARNVLDMQTYGIVDQRTTFAPPGPILMRAADHEWQSVARQLIRRAHVIVLILPPDREFGDGFMWEIDQIRQAGTSTRTIVLLPPCDQDTEGHAAALRRACVLLALLDGALDSFKAHEYELAMSDTTLVIRYTGDAGKWWETMPAPPGRKRRTRKQRTVVADVTYAEVLELAMLEIDHEHS